MREEEKEDEEACNGGGGVRLRGGGIVEASDLKEKDYETEASNSEEEGKG